MNLKFNLTFIVCLSRSPVLLVGTECGWLLAVTVKLAYSETEQVFEDLEQPEGTTAIIEEQEKRTETVLKAEVKIGKTLKLHKRSLKSPSLLEEGRGDLMIVAGEGGYVFLVNVSEEDGENQFLTVLGSIKLEGLLLAASFRDSTLLCLISTEEDTGVAGRRMCHVRAGRDGEMGVVSVAEIKESCCGVAIDASGCFFYTFLMRRKAVGKFVLQEEVPMNEYTIFVQYCITVYVSRDAFKLLIYIPEK